MSRITEILVAAFMPAVKAVGQAEIADLLSQLKTHVPPDEYSAILNSIYSAFSYLRLVALKTSTKIDDGLVDLVLEAVIAQANADSIALTPVSGLL